MKIFRNIVVSVLFILITGIVFAQKPVLLFDQLTDKSGRPLGVVTGVVQDMHGFLWISTTNGLFRYDGYNYKRFPSNESAESLPFSNITRMYYGASGKLWLNHYENIAAFRSEKYDTNFVWMDTLTLISDARVIEDKYGNLWVGPSKKGLFKYNLQTEELNFYSEPVPKYSPELLRFVDSLRVNSKKVTSLEKIENKADTSKIFRLGISRDVLVVCVGEADKSFTYDYGFIEKNREPVWDFNFADSRFAGGAENNRIQLNINKLTAGEYTLRYKSDNTNSYGNWENKPPTDTDLYGIAVIEISENDKAEIQRLIDSYKVPNAISSNQARDFLIDNDGNFCFVHPKGIDRFSNQSGKFEHIKIDFETLLGVDSYENCLATCLFQDKTGTFWIGTINGLLSYNLTTKISNIYQNTIDNDTILTSNYVTSIFEDSFGDLWVGTWKGLNLKEKGNSQFYHYKVDNQNRLYSNVIHQIYEDRSGIVWIATKGGLNRLRRSRFKFNNLEIARYQSYPVERSADGVLWYPGNENFIYSYDNQQKTVSKFEIEEEYFPTKPFSDDKDFTFNDIFSSPKGVWIAVDDELLYLEQHSQQVLQKAQVPEFEIDSVSVENKVIALRSDNEDEVWIFAMNGVYHFDIQKDEINGFIAFPVAVNRSELINAGNIKSISRIQDGAVYMRTEIGIIRVTLAKKAEYIYKYGEEILYNGVTNGNSFFDEKGNLWFAAIPNLFRLNTETLETEVIESTIKRDLSVCNVYADNDSLVWIYTDNGLFSYNIKNKRFSKHTNKEGLADNNVNGVLEDRQGNLWVSSLKGLTKLDLTTQRTYNYFRSTDFVSHSFVGILDEIRSRTGEVLFLTRKGYLSFYPDSINHVVPKIALTRFTMYGKEWPLDTVIYQKHLLNLNWDENFIAFEFSALDFTDPNKNQYKYRLENLDKNWNIVNAYNRKANYTNLDHGKYTLIIKASNSDKVWDNEGISVDIIIVPPWWKTWWFYGAMILLTIALIIGFIKMRERNLQREKRILEEKVRERTAEIRKQNVEIAKQRDVAEKQRDQIAKQKQEITDSIQYASRIQSAILPPEEIISSTLPDHFILFKPRDIVSGDFYWMSQKEDKTIIAAADCTGHGVPGAFMSMLGVAFLNEIVSKSEQVGSNVILDKLREQVIKALRQTGKANEAKDGMDIALLVFDKQTSEIQYSGAYNSLYLIRKSEKLAGFELLDSDTGFKKIEENGIGLVEVKADRMPIGIHAKAYEPFSKTTIPTQANDRFYIFSDGFVDQFGGKKGRKFMSKRFKELLLQVQNMDMNQQKEHLNTSIEAWRAEKTESSGPYEQIDDILVMGIQT